MTEGQTGGRTDGGNAGGMDGWLEGRTEGMTERQTGGRREGGSDGGREGRTKEGTDEGGTADSNPLSPRFNDCSQLIGKCNAGSLENINLLKKSFYRSEIGFEHKSPPEMKHGREQLNVQE